MAQYIDSVIVEGVARVGGLVVSVTETATANSTLTLNATSSYLQYFSGTTAGQIVRLPDATTLQVGAIFELWNASTQTIAVQASGGGALLTLKAGKRVSFYLRTNASAPGTWGSAIIDNSIITDEVLATPLAGFAASTNTTVLASDTLLQGLQKLQAQTNAINTARGAASGIATLDGSTKVTFSQLPTGVPVDISTTNAEGVATTLARSDHTHLGMRSLSVNGGTQRFGNINFNNGDGALIMDDGAGNFTFMGHDIAQAVVLDDMLFPSLGSGANQYDCNAVTAGGGTATLNTASVGVDCLGVVTLATGTNNNNSGRAAIQYFGGGNYVQFGTDGLRTVCEWRIKLTTLSTNAVNYQVFIGSFDSNAAGSPANGVYFYYNHNTNGGNWVLRTTAASSTTSVNSIVPAVAGSFVKLRIDVNAAGTQANFYINGAFAGSSNTTIPTAAHRWMVKMEKITTNTTTSRTMLVDYCAWRLMR